MPTYPNPLHVRPDDPRSIRADLYFPNGELVANCGSDRDLALEIARRWNNHFSLVNALESLVARCDGDEGVRADGSNIDTCAAHAALRIARGEE